MSRHVTNLTILLGAEGALYYRGPTRFTGTVVEGGDLVALEIPADYVAQRAAGSPYRLSIDDATGLPYWEAVPMSTGGSPVTVEDGGGGFLLVFDEDGNVVYA